ncbi:hypothetical protein DASC09_020320 [Saccharomycopsis crataegensis]|uniref:Mitogen-activated protein kinase n=1 Tax=Saccharomycopsis crataegensis TaxID=43959 RepID=A0AAV5QIT6_9ASCO|nr:hypothetical protein DASC09_020320 [Saccharomycopsis crataegensis]
MNYSVAHNDFNDHQIFGTCFQVTHRYTSLVPVGMGAYGLVCAADDTTNSTKVAVKKIHNPFATTTLSKRTYRELKLLKHLHHENLISLDDIFVSPSNDMYFVTELQGTDLHRLLKSRPLQPQFIKYFTYQILRGLKYVHSSGVIHRDLKPSNILINDRCDLKICDFGLARVQDPQMTGYVATRYYRAPEIMLTWQKYDKKVDIWSTACILAEMIDNKPLFPGTDHVHQFSIITELLGTPPRELIESITSKTTLDFVLSLPYRPAIPLPSRFLNFPDVDAIDLLSKMLLFDPIARVDAEASLEHPYLEFFHDTDDEPSANVKFDWSFNEEDLPVEKWEEIMKFEVMEYHMTQETTISEYTIPKLSQEGISELSVRRWEEQRLQNKQLLAQQQFLAMQQESLIKQQHGVLPFNAPMVLNNFNMLPHNYDAAAHTLPTGFQGQVEVPPVTAGQFSDIGGVNFAIPELIGTSSSGIITKDPNASNLDVNISDTLEPAIMQEHLEQLEYSLLGTSGAGIPM